MSEVGFYVRGWLGLWLVAELLEGLCTFFEAAIALAIYGNIYGNEGKKYASIVHCECRSRSNIIIDDGW